MKKTVYIFGAAILALGLVGLVWGLNRPLPIPLDDPKAQSVKDVLIKGYMIEYLLSCDPKANVHLLDEVYKDTSDYKQTSNHRALVAKYLGEEVVDRSGYLTYKKAYYLWRRSGDPYPSISPAANPTLDYLYTLVPTPKPVWHCPDPLEEPQLRYVSIAIREEKAIVVYDYGAYRRKTLLRKIDGVWFVVNLRNIAMLA